MFISLHDLQLHKHIIDFDEELQAGSIDLGAEVRQSGSLKSDGRAMLVQEPNGHKGYIDDIRIAGKLQTQLEILCARCLEPVKQPLSRQFDLLYRPQSVNSGEDETEIEDKDTEVGFYQGDGILLEDVLREQILLAMPIKTVCSEACKGLCPQCGKNLNTGQCNCEQATSDPRWEALKNLKDKLRK